MGGFQKMKFLDFTVHPGSILYIPPFWHYSIKFKEENQLVHVFNYGSLMNVVSNTFNLSNHYYEKIINNRGLTKPDESKTVSETKTHVVDTHAVDTHSDVDLVKVGL